MSYQAIKYLHTLAATITIAGFIVRGFWMMSGSPRLESRITRIAPHIVDSVLLVSGIAMVTLLALNPISQTWLVAKLTGVVAYIVLGSIAIKRGRTREQRLLALAAALSVFAYVAGVALSKSPASWLAYLA